MSTNQLIKTILAILKQAKVCHTDPCTGLLVEGTCCCTESGELVLAPAQNGVDNIAQFIGGELYIPEYVPPVLPFFNSNSLAILGGLSIGDTYKLDVDNIYGLPSGLHIDVI